MRVNRRLKHNPMRFYRWTCECGNAIEAMINKNHMTSLNSNPKCSRCDKEMKIDRTPQGERPIEKEVEEDSKE